MTRRARLRIRIAVARGGLAALLGRASRGAQSPRPWFGAAIFGAAVVFLGLLLGAIEVRMLWLKVTLGGLVVACASAAFGVLAAIGGDEQTPPSE